jgi:Mg-chelatase subunit ChlD
MTLLSPVWLMLAVPLGVALWVWRPPSRLMFGLRLASMTLATLALAGLALRLPSRAGTVVVIADRSYSMPADSDARARGAIDIIREAMTGDDQLRVVAFGSRAAVESVPAGTRFPGFANEVGGDGSVLGEAVELGLGLIPPGRSGRLVLLTDGKWTGKDPATLVPTALARGVAIDFRPEERSQAGDLAISRVDAPSSVSTGESFLITAWVQAPEAGTVSYTLRHGGQVVSDGRRAVTTGLNRFTFRGRAVEAGNQDYVFEVHGEGGKDPVPENNRARMLVGVTGPKPILHLAPGPTSGLNDLLRKGGLDVRLTDPGKARWSLESLSRYSAVLLENVPADRIGDAGMETLSSWVREGGGGLFLTGGQNSYGPGGYYKSPLDPVLPVSMELRNEHRKLALAIMVVLDRSGSMAAPVGGGRQKMDLANLGTASVLDLLGPQDEFGCLAVDTEAHVIAPLEKVKSKEKVRSDILRIQSMGGGIFVYVALAKAAEMLSRATAGTKHIILFSDAADSEEPGDYKNLLAKLEKANITVSVIGLGKETDVDGELLKDIARRGKGRIFFTDRAEELPRLFAQDTFVVARNTFIDEPARVRHLPGLRGVTGMDLESPASLAVGGYNLCYQKPEASLGTMTLDEYKAPLVSAWQAGAGRVVCYTGEADGKYTGAMARYAQAGELFTSLARYAAGPLNPLGDGMLLTQAVREGVSTITLHLDPDRSGEAMPSLPAVRILRSLRGGPPRSEKAVLRWTGPDTLAAEIPLGAEEVLLATVEVPGHRPAALPPVCLPYSPEHRPATRESGLAALERLARATGGMERTDLSSVWKDLPRQAQLLPVGRWLLLAAVLAWLLEVLERRTSVLSNLLRRGPRARSVADEGPRPGERAARPAPRPQPRPAATAAPTPPPPPPPAEAPRPAAPAAPAAPVPAADAGLLEALRKARQKARGRE